MNHDNEEYASNNWHVIFVTKWLAIRLCVFDYQNEGNLGTCA